MFIFLHNWPRLSDEWTHDLFCKHNICPAILHNPRPMHALCTDWTLDLFCSARTCVCILAHFTKVHDMYICISYANNHSWPYCLWELAPPPFYLNTMARGLSYASGRGQCRGQLIPEANYLAWVKTMTLRRPPNQSTSEIVSDNDHTAATSSIHCCQQSYTATHFYPEPILQM